MEAVTRADVRNVQMCTNTRRLSDDPLRGYRRQTHLPDIKQQQVASQASPPHLGSTPAPSAAIEVQETGNVRAQKPPSNLDRRLLRGVLVEALEAQHRKRTALEEQLAKQAPLLQSDNLYIETPGDDKVSKLRAKAMRRAQEVPQHLAAVADAVRRLEDLMSKFGAGADLVYIHRELEDLGLGSRLDTLDLDKITLNQWGRPDGFRGLVVKSARGVPILVGQRSYSDGLLRRIGRGADLWFQVCQGRGSRVLLRTSMVRSLGRSHRECMEMAADLAAHFSDSRGAVQDDVDVEVMYTDSRHVAKRGDRVGQMKENKKLGTIWARPARVDTVVREAQEQQGWL